LRLSTPDAAGRAVARGSVDGIGSDAADLGGGRGDGIVERVDALAKSRAKARVKRHFDPIRGTLAYSK